MLLQYYGTLAEYARMINHHEAPPTQLQDHIPGSDSQTNTVRRFDEPNESIFEKYLFHSLEIK